MPLTSISELTQEHLKTAIEWISAMAKENRWNLTHDEVAALVGLNADCYEDMKCRAANCEALTMNEDTIERISLILGIFKSLQLLSPDNQQNFAFTCFNTPNTGALLKGKSIKNYLLEGRSIDAFYDVKNYLDYSKYS